MSLETVTATIRHARLAGQIHKRIATIKAGRARLDDVTQTISDLSFQLQDWWDSLPTYAKQDLRSLGPQLPENVHIFQVIYLHYSYYASLVAIHSILVHPWNSSALKIDPHQKEEYSRLVASSLEVFADATRRLIHNLPHVDINALTPKWYAMSLVHLDLEALVILADSSSLSQAGIRVSLDRVDQPFHLHHPASAFSLRRV